jgi:hypothetical protein
LFNEYKNIVRHAEAPHAVVLDTSIVPYYCVYCHEQFRYTYPLCSDCLLRRWKVKMHVDKTSNTVICTNGGKSALLTGHVFPDPFKKGFMNNEEFARVYSSKLNGEKLGYVRASDTHVQNWLSYKSLLAHFKIQPADYNVVLDYDSSKKVGWLKVVEDITIKGELILKGEPTTRSASFLLDIDEYALAALADDQVEGGMLVRAAHHSESSEEPLEIDGDDGMYYEDDEEYGEIDDDEGSECGDDELHLHKITATE